ncbi:hypothetical protein KOR42_20970 [Thalassoglobus neptunius]|uniref:Uncharacterized protein n=1 Tax=Thalassoglobus neptunius TaxID=1938619 RepID=A0A5C5X8M8_9PLAN|nr:hypothetical protein [Thalassoglobus neptunius]TWT58711.1 hypothetical protein KOR42_20970 [Thalassoglobus neptunius]
MSASSSPSCELFRRTLQEAIENRTPLLAGVEDHPKHCGSAECRNMWEDHLLLERAIAEWRNRPVSIDMTDAVVAALTEEASNTPSTSIHVERAKPAKAFSSTNRLFTPKAAGVSIVAATTLFVFLSSLMTRPQPEIVTREEVVVPASDSSNLAEFQDAESLNLDAVKDFGKSYGKLLKGTATTLTGSLSVVLSDSETAVIEPTANWFSSLNDQLKTIDEQFDKTLKMVVPQEEEMQDQTQRSLPGQQSDLRTA